MLRFTCPDRPAPVGSISGCGGSMWVGCVKHERGAPGSQGVQTMKSETMLLRSRAGCWLCASAWFWWPAPRWAGPSWWCTRSISMVGTMGGNPLPNCWNTPMVTNTPKCGAKPKTVTAQASSFGVNGAMPVGRVPVRQMATESLWRSLGASGWTCSDRLPRNMTDHELTFVVDGRQLYVYVVTPQAPGAKIVKQRSSRTWLSNRYNVTYEIYPQFDSRKRGW